MKKLLLYFFLITSIHLNAQLTIQDSLTISQVETLLTGLGVTISGVTINCHPTSLAQFSGLSEVPISNGLLLTTGNSNEMANAASYFAGSGIGTNGDSTIYYALGAAIPTYDGCSIEFDCKPIEDTLMFNFAFGSEEYPEYVGSAFNDAFGIFMSGPGITGEVNVAALPTSQIVSINNVNATTNAAYFIDNTAGVNVAFDGFTTNLQVFAVVIPDSIYHFNIAISDVADGVFDSAVMLEAFSFQV
jgi:hypothetical protein